MYRIYSRTSHKIYEEIFPEKLGATNNRAIK